MLQFLPWCATTKSYDLGDLRLLRVTAEEPIPGVQPAPGATIKRFLQSYRDIEGNVVDPCVLVTFRSDDATRELDGEELGQCAEEIQLACFSSLSARRFFRSPYSNSSCFIRVIQTYQDQSGIAVRTRRRDGGTLDGRTLPTTIFGIPPQAAAVHEVYLDEVVFRALVRHRDAVKTSEWMRWQNAIDCFNFANSDDSGVPLHVEWIMVASAFQRLTDARSDADAIASAFESAIQPEQAILAGSAAVRPPINSNAAARSLRSVWAREFYELRGEYAHGKLTTNRAHIWEPFEHLLISAIAFPLLVKSLLAQAGNYVITDDDWAQIDAFESLLDSDFMVAPSDQMNSWDFVWPRLQSRHHGRRRLRALVNEAFERAR